MLQKTRTVITTDGEVDDMNSFIRALLYANDMDICGIVLTSSVYHYAGNKEKQIEPYRWTGTQWLFDMIDAYGKVYDNLKIHDQSYPTPEYLKSITKIGNISYVGEMQEVTEGSKFLEELFLDDDPRKLYVQTWGGTNTTARALKSIEERYSSSKEWEKIQDKIYQKLVLYIILDQDDTYGEYIAKKWPLLKIVNDRSNFWYFAYMWQNNDKKLIKTLQSDWCYNHLVHDKGPLMDKYALIGDGKALPGELHDELRGTNDYLKKNPSYKKYDFISEGDSPSFFYLFNNGLRSLEDPSYGGWGGRFQAKKDLLYINDALDYNPYTKQFEAKYSLCRWIEDIQNDFAARVDWCLADKYENAEHCPQVLVEQGNDIWVQPGEKVQLKAVGKNMDHGKLSYRWWRYFEADTYQDSPIETKAEVLGNDELLLDVVRQVGENEKLDTIVIHHKNTDEMFFTVPADAKKDQTIHMIIEVQSDGKHHLKAYQRVIIHVK